MLEKSNLLMSVGRILPVLKSGESLDIRSYKRDRSVFICCLQENEFSLIESGFYLCEFKGNKNHILKQLKRVIKREFPRSHKVRIYRSSAMNSHSLVQ